METSVSGSILRTILVVIAGIIGFCVLVAGVYLAALGGSWYYIFAGIVFLYTAYLLFKKKSAALVLFAIYLVLTVVWGLWEVGSDFFALAPRLDIIGVFALLLLIPTVGRAHV